MTVKYGERNQKTENNVVPLTKPETAPAGCGEDKGNEVLVHVRFYPNADVNTIDYRPEHLCRQDWYYRLRYAAPQNYQVFAGGRGFFRIQRGAFEAILSEDAP
jgi:hypothetical protein